MRCAACNNKLRLVGNRCGSCGSSLNVATGKQSPTPNIPTRNQVSGRDDETPFQCPKCQSFNIHFCNIAGSLRCRKCSSTMTYIEGLAWNESATSR